MINDAFLCFQSPYLISADYEGMCGQPESTDYLMVLIGLEAALLFIILAKLAYDVWNYHRTGEMPWLARNIYIG